MENHQRPCDDRMKCPAAAFRLSLRTPPVDYEKCSDRRRLTLLSLTEVYFTSWDGAVGALVAAVPQLRVLSLSSIASFVGTDADLMSRVISSQGTHPMPKSAAV